MRSENDGIERHLAVCPEFIRQTDSNRFVAFNLKVKDYSANMGKYEKGTIGYLSGLNHPKVSVDTIEQLLQYQY